MINSSINAENNSIFSGTGAVNGSGKNDRRQNDRRQVSIPVEVDRRTGDRRSGQDRRLCTVAVECDKRALKDTFCGNNSVAIESNRRKSDRRQSNIPVENDRRKGDRREEKEKEICFVNDKQQHPNKPERKEFFFEACEALPPLRRIKALPDQIENGNGTTALGMASLALINLPEDVRDIGQSAKQIKSLINDEKFKGSYDYKDYQHPFSFFRGTLLHKWLLRNIDNGKKWALWLAEHDKSLDTTLYGEKLLNHINVKIDNSIETGIKNLCNINEKAISYNGSAFGKLTARAMRRTTLIGVMAMGLLEAPKIIKSITKGDTAKDKAVSTGKQGIKSTINIASITAGIGYMGALGAKYGGPTGSLVGMGLGAVLGSKLSQQAKKIID